jgi:hypothetical protein
MPSIIRRDAALLERGAVHYGDHNWTRGIPSARCADSALRHLFQYLDGDRAEDHLAACRFNVGCIMFNEDQVAAGRMDPALHNISNWRSRRSTSR